MEDFEASFVKVRPIILKLRRFYYVHLWDYEDWLQEGRLILFKLLSEQSQLFEDKKKLLVYFKTKFSNYIKDVIRSQESMKRRFNRLAYEEVGELAHTLSDRGMMLDDYVAFQENLQRVSLVLSLEERGQLEQVIRGERFVGKKAFLRKLRPLWKEFEERGVR